MTDVLVWMPQCRGHGVWSPPCAVLRKCLQTQMARTTNFHLTQQHHIPLGAVSAAGPRVASGFVLCSHRHAISKQRVWLQDLRHLLKLLDKLLNRLDLKTMTLVAVWGTEMAKGMVPSFLRHGQWGPRS